MKTRTKESRLVIPNAMGKQNLDPARIILIKKIITLVVRTNTAGRNEPGWCAKKLLIRIIVPSVTNKIPTYMIYQVHRSRKRPIEKIKALIAYFPTLPLTCTVRIHTRDYFSDLTFKIFLNLILLDSTPIKPAFFPRQVEFQYAPEPNKVVLTLKQLPVYGVQS
jgi:hypothetical protein